MERFCDDEKTNKLLIECGREAGANLLISAVDDAENEEQMNKQIFVCRRAAIHILATEMFNRRQQHGQHSGEFLMELAQEIREEMSELDNSKMFFSQPKGAH